MIKTDLFSLSFYSGEVYLLLLRLKSKYNVLYSKPRAASSQIKLSIDMVRRSARVSGMPFHYADWIPLQRNKNLRRVLTIFFLSFVLSCYFHLFCLLNFSSFSRFVCPEFFLVLLDLHPLVCVLTFASRH